MALGSIGEITTRQRAARDLIIQQRADGLAELRAEAHRLQSPQYMRKLATRLERARTDALNLQYIPVASRPPPSAANLVHHQDALTAVISALEHGSAPLRAIALTDQLLDGGYTAALYTLPARQLGSEIERIQLLVLLGSPDRDDPAPARGSTEPIAD